MDLTRCRDGSRDGFVVTDRLFHDLRILSVKPAGGVVADELCEGNWEQRIGKVKQPWGKTASPRSRGNREQLEGKIQARYGYAKDQVRKDIDDWLRLQ